MRNIPQEHKTFITQPPPPLPEIHTQVKYQSTFKEIFKKIKIDIFKIPLSSTYICFSNFLMVSNLASFIILRLIETSC